MVSSGDISSLVSIISNAANVVESYYKNSPKPYVPALDDTEPHPLDTKLYPLDVKRAIQSLEGACAQLCATVARPNHTVTNKILEFYQPNCLSLALNAGIADILLAAPSGMHVSQISERCGVEQDKLARVLRLLCTNYIFHEVETDVFANNRLSMQLLSSNPLSSFGLFATKENSRAASLLTETLLDPTVGHSGAIEDAPFSRYSRLTRGLWSYLNTESNERCALFTRALVGYNEAIDAASLVTDFPWGSLPHGSTVVDVGGGSGYIAMQLCKRHPNLRLKLQDLPEPIEHAKTKFWPEECPEAIESGRIEFKPLNFLVEAPIEGCDIYVLKHVIHNWADLDCIKILSNIRKAMKPSSRLLIHEYVLQTAARLPESEANIQAPHPLLPNYGLGRNRQYTMDMAMLCMMNSKVRTLDHLIKLGKAAGLSFSKLWDLGEMDVVEFEPAL